MLYPVTSDKTTSFCYFRRTVKQRKKQTMARSRTRSRSPRRRRSRSRSRDRRRRDRDEPPRNRSRERATGGPGKGLPGGKAAGNKAASNSNVPMTAPPILTDKDLEGKSQVNFLYLPLTSVPDPLDLYASWIQIIPRTSKKNDEKLVFCCLFTSC